MVGFMIEGVGMDGGDNGGSEDSGGDEGMVMTLMGEMVRVTIMEGGGNVVVDCMIGGIEIDTMMRGVVPTVRVGGAVQRGVTTWVKVGIMGFDVGIEEVAIGGGRVESIPIIVKVIFFLFGKIGAL